MRRDANKLTNFVRIGPEFFLVIRKSCDVLMAQSALDAVLHFTAPVIAKIQRGKLPVHFGTERLST